MNLAMTYEKPTMSEKMKYVYGIMGKMKSVKYDLVYGHNTPSHASSSTTQPNNDDTYLKDDYDPPWYIKENNNKLECYNIYYVMLYYNITYYMICYNISIIRLNQCSP
jgi:hypothetical protein